MSIQVLEPLVLRFFVFKFLYALADLIDDLLCGLGSGGEGILGFLVLRTQGELFQAGLRALRERQGMFSPGLQRSWFHVTSRMMELLLRRFPREESRYESHFMLRYGTLTMPANLRR